MSLPDFHVLVIGGGSCGLTIAQGLRKAGISYTLFERDSTDDYHHRPRDWGSLFHWSQQYMENCLIPELWARRQEMFVDSGFDYDTMPYTAYYNAETGEVIKTIPAPKTARVSRAKVRKLLCQGLRIEYAKRLAAVDIKDDGVVAHFEDGTTASGSMLLGCDGGHSVARRYIVGNEAAKGFDTGFTMMNHQSTYPHNPEIALGLRAKHPIITTTFAPTGGASALIATLDVPYDENGKQSAPEQWKFQIHTSWKGSPRKADFSNDDDQQKLRAFWQHRFSQLGAPWGPAGLEVDPSIPLPLDDTSNFKPVGDFAWDNHGGRITIAGDAAHNMLPHRGQGLNNAIFDSSQIVDAIEAVVSGEKPLAQAIDEYEAEMRPRGAEEVERTLQQADASSSTGMGARDFTKLIDSPMLTTGLHRSDGKVESG